MDQVRLEAGAEPVKLVLVFPVINFIDALNETIIMSRKLRPGIDANLKGCRR
jgi:hypothetical protein